MTFDPVGMNFLAVLVAAIVIFLIGGLWYQALFGKLWVSLHGFSDEEIKRMQERYPPAVFFPVILAAYLVLCYAAALLVGALDLDSVVGGVIFGVVLWLIVAAIGVTAHITSNRHIGLFVIDTAYQLVIFIVAGAILAAWR